MSLWPGHVWSSPKVVPPRFSKFLTAFELWSCPWHHRRPPPPRLRTTPAPPTFVKLLRLCDWLVLNLKAKKPFTSTFPITVWNKRRFQLLVLHGLSIAGMPWRYWLWTSTLFTVRKYSRVSSDCGPSMYRRSIVLSGSKYVLSFLHAASSAAERHFTIFTFNHFLGLLPVLPAGLIPCMNKDPVMTCSLM